MENESVVACPHNIDDQNQKNRHDLNQSIDKYKRLPEFSKLHLGLKEPLEEGCVLLGMSLVYFLHLHVLPGFCQI